MPYVRLTLPPGFSSQQTQFQNAGQWFDGNLMRWRQGELEKMGGWERLNPDACLALIRALHAWEDLSNHLDLLIGTDFGAEILVNGVLFPLGARAEIAGGDVAGDATFQVGAASKVVTVATSTVPAGVGTFFFLDMAVSIGGRVLAKSATFSVASIGANSFTFLMPLNSTGAEGPVIGLRHFVDSGINLLTVTHKAHGLVPTNVFTIGHTTSIDSAPGVQFVIPAGAVVTVVAPVTANTFTIDVTPFGYSNGSTLAVYEGQTLSAVGVTSSGVISIPVPLVLGNPQFANWFLENLGETGLVLYTGVSGGPLLTYDPPIENGSWLTRVTSGSPETAPQMSMGMLVAMPQAQVILLGTEPIMGSGVIDPLLVRFSDAGTFAVWTATVSNQAGSYRLSRGSKIVGGIQAPQTTLLLTDTDIWAMSYIGPPLIYGFTIMGTGCGLVAPHAIGTLGRTTYWIANKNLWQVGDTGVQVLLCQEWDFFFGDLDVININKAHVGINSSTNEVTFWAPLASAIASIPVPVNLLLFSQQLNQEARWHRVYLSSVVSNLASAPDGTSTRTSMVDNTVNGAHGVSQTLNKPSEPLVYTLSIYAHKDSQMDLFLLAQNVDGVSKAWAVFDPTTGVQISASGAMAVSADSTTRTADTTTITADNDFGFNAFTFLSTTITTDALATGIAGNGWLRYALKFKSDDDPLMQVNVRLSNAGVLVYAGTIKNLLVWGAQLNLTNTLLPYTMTSGVETQNEVGKYVKYNPVERLWDHGYQTRTAWLDNNVYGTPLGGDANARIQQHERGYDDDGEPMRGVFAETGFNVLGDGTLIPMVDEVQPDFKWFGSNGGIHITLKGAMYAGDEDKVQSYGPYSVTKTTRFFNPRMRARYVAVRFDWAELPGFSARIGASAFHLKPTGKTP